MYRDPTEFRQRFLAYKEGKIPYENGLPKYAGGTPSYDSTVEFLKKHEGFKDTTYLDGNGIPTIGYGFTDSSLIKKGTISRAEADHRLKQEISARESVLSKMKNWDKLNEDSKTALRSYYYNYPAGFKPTTKFMKAWNAGNYEEAIRLVDAGMNDKKNPGLKKRRLEELALLKADPFLRPVLTIQPTPIVNQPVSTAVRQVIPAEHTIPTYDTTVSPYISGKPMIKLRPRIQLPNLIELMEDSEWEPGFPGLKNGKLPGFQDGRQQLYKKHNVDNTFVDELVERSWKDLTQWADKWLKNREKLMANNIDTYKKLIYRGSSIDRLHVAPIPILDLLDKYRLHNARQIIKEQIDYAKSVPIYDLRSNWQYLKAKDKSYHLQDFLQMDADTQGAWFTPSYKNDFKDGEIFIAPYGAFHDTSSPLHEFIHAATDKYSILLSEIDKIFGGYTKESGRKYFDKYFDDSSEVYSRLMLFRYNNKLDPNKKVTNKDLNNWRNNNKIKDTNLLNRYDDNTLLRLFNEVAQNNADGDILFMASNGKLPYFKNGKSSIHINPANRGKFNATKKRTGKTTEELAHSKNPLTRKRAIFALNSRKWHH